MVLFNEEITVTIKADDDSLVSAQDAGNRLKHMLLSNKAIFEVDTLNDNALFIIKASTVHERIELNQPFAKRVSILMPLISESIICGFEDIIDYGFDFHFTGLGDVHGAMGGGDDGETSILAYQGKMGFVDIVMVANIGLM